MATTARSVITFGLKKAGIVGSGRTPEAEEINDGLADFNDMLALWTRQRWMTWDTLNLGVTSTGATTYTAGPGGDYDVNPRPARILSGFLRNLVNPTGLNVDTPLKIIDAREDYDRIALKELTSFTRYVFLDTSYPLAVVRPYPVPTATIYALFLSFQDVMPVLTLNTDLSVFPAEYLAAMKFNLARWYRQAYGKGMKPDLELNRLATSTLNVIKNSNMQIPEMVMPTAVIGRGPGYNILSDQFS